MAILARLLLPEDFGLVAIAISVIAIVESFANLNIDAALIRDRTDGTALYDSAWTINVAAACLLALIIVFGAEPAAAFFKEPRVAPILYWLAVATALGGFTNIAIVEFQKRLDFRTDFAFQFAVRIVSVALTVAAAFVLRNYWALVIGAVSRAALRVALSYVARPYLPRLSLARLRPLLSFSRWLLADNVISAINSRVSQLILGRLTAVDLLAFYTLGAEIARLATTEVQAPIRRAIYPGFALLADEIEALRKMFLSSAALLTLVGLPIASGIGFTADYAVIFMLGGGWLPTIPIVQILTLGGVIVSLRTGSHLVYMAVNRPHLNLWLSAIALAVSIPLLIVGVRADGIAGAAWASVAVALILLLADYAIVMPILRLRLTQLVACFWRPLAGVAFMAAALYGIRLILPPPTGWTFAAFALVLCVVTGAVAYTAAVLALWQASGRPEGAEHAILSDLGHRLRRTR
jgi:O-antigen/teichoic acid export membrane protein